MYSIMTFRLLCDAIPFCYGPAAALESFLEALLAIAPAPMAIDVLATGSTHELLSRAGFPVRLLAVDSEDEQALATLPLHSYNAFLNVCNPVSFAFVRNHAGIPTAYIDFLLWMHTGPAAEYFNADLYLAENYPGTAEWIAQRGHELPNLAVIPPLVKPPVQRQLTSGSLLVGLGGLYSRLTVPGKNSRYAPFMLKSIVEALPAGRFSRITVAGPEGIAGVAREILSAVPGARYASLSHDQFMEKVSQAEAFVSHPGLYAAFEGMMSGVPTAFLPPSNYTQVLQLRHYRERGLADHSFAWEDAGMDEIRAGLPEADGVRAVLRLVAEAETSPRAVNGLRDALASFFERTPASLLDLGAAQQHGVAQYGVGGPHAAAERFLQWTRSIGRRAATS
jgi:hypothetical protein